MKLAGIAEARKNLSQMVEDSFFHGQRWVLTKSGSPRAVLISFDDFEELQSRIATYEELTDPEAIEMNRIADADIAAGRVIEHEVVMAKLRELRRKRT
ncbi:MAG: type II toxin-antitoxin system Phd/YefM family antitoxin [Thermoleophilia bacterium]